MFPEMKEKETFFDCFTGMLFHVLTFYTMAGALVCAVIKVKLHV